jgi:chromosome segregation ATPase
MMEGIFKTAVNGFKKSDVLTYVDKQETQYRLSEHELKNTISSISSSLAQVKLENNVLSTKTGDLKLVNDKLSADKALLERNKDEIFAELKRSGRALEESKALIAELRAEINGLYQNIDNKKITIAELEGNAELLREELSKTNKSRERIGKVLLEAQKTADVIIENAATEAERIINDAKGRLLPLLKRSEDFKEQLSGLRGGLNAFVAQSGEIINDIEKTVVNAKNNFSLSLDASDGIGGYREHVESEYMGIFESEMLEEYQIAEKQDVNAADEAISEATRLTQLGVEIEELTTIAIPQQPEEAKSESSPLFDFSLSKSSFNWDED